MAITHSSKDGIDHHIQLEDLGTVDDHNLLPVWLREILMTPTKDRPILTLGGTEQGWEQIPAVPL